MKKNLQKIELNIAPGNSGSHCERRHALTQSGLIVMLLVGVILLLSAMSFFFSIIALLHK